MPFLYANDCVFWNWVDAEFPNDFVTTIKQIFKFCFRVFAHIYHVHFEQMLHLESEAHLNTLFHHFTLFAIEFDLIDRKEFSPMQELIDLLHQ